MDYSFVVGCGSTGFATTTVIKKDGTTSTTENVRFAPKAKFIVEYKGSLYALNVEVDGTKYPNRAYKSSTPTDAVTYVNGDFKGSIWQIEVDSVRYLKAGMTVDIYGENSSTKKVDSLSIVSVDKKNNKITFAETTIDVLDRDEIYLEDKKDELVILWNTDYPNPEASDFLEISLGNNELPDITGAKVFNNRLWITTEHSVWKWDGANLVCINKNHGNLSHWSMLEIGGYIVLYDRTGFWAYSENGLPQLLSKPIQPYVDAIKSTVKPVGVVDGNLMKVWVGELGNIDDYTTSTSTSSTSTSTTSTSTSSTSTSSTSTSSTSTSISHTTSTSSTSSSTYSTSSTSSSTSSTSTSLSTSSTSTSTAAPTTEATVLVYDFAINAWSVDVLDRNIRSMFLHKMHGHEKIYFGDDTGRVFRDNTTNTDHGKSIPFLIQTKRQHQNAPEMIKTYRKLYIHSENGQNATVYISIDGGAWKSYGQLDKEFTVINLGDIKGKDIALQVAQNDKGVGCWLLGWEVMYLSEEYAY